jgi:acylphosphatase
METIQRAAIKINVSGTVQGVGYRYYIARVAYEYGLCGYAKNLWNGDVEIFAEGPKEFLEELAGKAKEGPRHARVESCKIEWLEYENKYDKFEIF